MALNFEKIAHQGRAIRRQDAFRMELHSLDGKERWRNPHDLALRSGAPTLRAPAACWPGRQSRSDSVPPGKSLRHAGKHALGIAGQPARSCHAFKRPARTTLRRTLRPATGAPGTRPGSESARQRPRSCASTTPASRGAPGPEKSPDGSARARALLDRDDVVAVHVHLGAQHQKGLHQVVGERVVIVSISSSLGRALISPPPRSRAPRRSTALFAMTSWYSASGELSATMPPPA